MDNKLSLAPSAFLEAFQGYLGAIHEAHIAHKSHDHLRGLFVEFIGKAFGISAQEVELEKGVKAASFRGSIDLLYQDIIFEFKRNLKAEREKGKEELENYLRSLPLGLTRFGILTDGLAFEVYVLADGGLALRDKADLGRFTPEEAFLWLDAFLFSAKQVVPTAPDILRRFGATSPVFLSAAERLRRMLGSTWDDPSLQVKFDQWRKLLAYVYGSSIGDQELFLRHTYLSVLSRLIAFAALFRRQPQGEELPGVVNGDAFRKQGYLNLVEEDFFSWLLLPSLLQEAEGLLLGLAYHLTVYDLGKINEDLLKQLYQGLVDPETRHDLGEFYTPDWLAELTLREAGFKPGMSLLDPACGSGTFLFTAIRLLREQGFEGQGLVDYCRERVCGVDIHPLAVTIARINYLLALAPDLKGYAKALTIPVYMANSLLRTQIGMSRELIPIDAEGGYFNIPRAMAEDAELLDQAVETMKTYALETWKEAATGFKRWLVERGLGDWAFAWSQNLKLMRKLINEERNTIWSFILMNFSRPIFFRARKFALVIGNPPWLAYRDIKDAAYQKNIRELVFEYGLLGKKERKHYANIELASLFFAFGADTYLKEGGTIALVMPRSVLTGAKQHARFQELLLNRSGWPPGLALREVIDLEGVSPLFNVPACVLITDKGKAVPVEVTRLTLRGDLFQKNLSWKQARKALRRSTEHLPPEKLFPPPPIPSPYLKRFNRGAFILPRPLWFVHPTGNEIVDRDKPYLESHPDAVEKGKVPWKGKKLSGEVEARFLYTTLLSKHLLPFGLTQLDSVVLPLEIKASGMSLLSSEAASARGFPGLAGWLRQAEKVWEKDRKPGSPATAQDYLDYWHLLTRQDLKASFRVIYNTSGTYLAGVVLSQQGLQACGVQVPGFIANEETVIYQTDDETEARYLCACLNAPCVDQAIKPFQTRGAWGERHIHRRPFEVVNIPKFNPQEPRHLRLAELSRECHRKVAGLLPQLKGRAIGRLRNQVREALKPELEEIDALVKGILRG